MPIRTKLVILFLAVVLIPLLFAESLFYSNAKTALQQTITADLNVISHFKAHEIHLLLDRLKMRAVDFSSDGLIKDCAEKINSGSMAAKNQLFIHLSTNKKPLESLLESIDIIDPEGKTISSTDPARIGFNAAAEKYFIRGRENIYVCDMRLENKIPVLTIAVPLKSIRSPKKIIGVLINRYNMSTLNNILNYAQPSDSKNLNNSVNIKKTLEILLVNKDKMMLTKSLFGEDTQLRLKVDTYPVKCALEENKEVSGLWPDYRGIPIVGSSEILTISDFKWIIVSKQDIKEAFAPIDRLKKTAYIIAILAIITTSIIAMTVSQSFSKPIMDLQKGARMMGAGNLDYRVETKEKNELGVLAQALNNMAEDLKKSISYNRSLIEASLDPLVTISSEGKITDVNEATIKVTGISRENLIGADFADYFTEPEKARDGYKEVFSKGVVTDYPLTIRGKDGKLMDVLYNASVYKDAEGNILGVFAAARDITERKKMEDNIKKLNETLRQRVIDLNNANKELETFSYSVSHDLRAPLRAIDGFSDAVLEDYFDKLDDTGKKYLTIIRKGAQDMGQLIDDILDFSRFSKKELAASLIDMNNLVNEILEELKLTCAGRQIQFNIGSLPLAYGDRPMIRQVLVNLLSNAVKFTQSKEKTIIEISGQSGENENIYSVKDNGAGFDETYADKLFGLFQRLHAADEFKGTGVGLAITQRIINRHGGKIWAKGKINEGAEFYFSLPKKGG